MNMLIKTILLATTLIMVACSTRVTGPVTGNKYEVDVGCTEDMQRYRQEREEIVGKKTDKIKAKDIQLECPTDEQTK